MKNKKSLLAAAAVSGLILTSAYGDAGAMKAKKAMEASETVMCHGVNTCSGKGECAGKVGAIELKCGGQNTCGGKGLLKMTKKECEAKGGKAATKS